jgi:hypothetical protein
MRGILALPVIGPPSSGDNDPKASFPSFLAVCNTGDKTSHFTKGRGESKDHETQKAAG